MDRMLEYLRTIFTGDWASWQNEYNEHEYATWRGGFLYTIRHVDSQYIRITFRDTNELNREYADKLLREIADYSVLNFSSWVYVYTFGESKSHAVRSYSSSMICSIDIQSPGSINTVHYGNRKCYTPNSR